MRSSSFIPGLNRDLVLAGIFLHDIAKTWELTYDAAFGYSDGGQLIGHIVKSVLWVEEKAKQVSETLGEPMPRPLIEVLEHIILSHHDKPEFGSPKVPATPEAIAVHMIENMDAKLMMALGSCRGENVGRGKLDRVHESLRRQAVSPGCRSIRCAGRDRIARAAGQRPAGKNQDQQSAL